MAKVNAIPETSQVRKIDEHIKKNFDEAYYLMWAIGINTGFRITDITELRYENVDFDLSNISIAENKGTRANRARAKAKVVREAIEKQKNYALLRSDIDLYIELDKADSTDAMVEIMCKSLSVSDKKALNLKIKKAEDSAAEKRRTAKLPQWLTNLIKKRMTKYSDIDSGNLFDKQTLSRARAKAKTGVISRQAAWQAFSKVTDLVKAMTSKLSNSFRISPHSLRKTYCRGLFFNNNRDVSVVMDMVGHSTQKQSLEYIDVTSEAEIKAANNLHDAYAPLWA